MWHVTPISGRKWLITTKLNFKNSRGYFYIRKVFTGRKNFFEALWVFHVQCLPCNSLWSKSPPSNSIWARITAWRLACRKVNSNLYIAITTKAGSRAKWGVSRPKKQKKKQKKPSPRIGKVGWGLVFFGFFRFFLFFFGFLKFFLSWWKIC